MPRQGPAILVTITTESEQLVESIKRLCEKHSISVERLPAAATRAAGAGPVVLKLRADAAALSKKAARIGLTRRWPESNRGPMMTPAEEVLATNEVYTLPLESALCNNICLLCQLLKEVRVDAAFLEAHPNLKKKLRVGHSKCGLYL